ncbi:alpha/beta hydrolase [Candidatus Uhrbacteria bacterium]|nr:alpha/beta hydrolase [Candidatus Uhrbacteria bacterium]
MRKEFLLFMVGRGIPKKVDSIAVFSDNDSYVPFDNQDDFKNTLGSAIVIEHSAGHFSGAMDSCIEPPIALESLLKLL